MTISSSENVTQLLLDWSQGNQTALDELLPLVYDELRRLAGRHLRRERADHTLQPTALVHEAYLRLIDQREVRWQNRAHFFAIAAQMMRRILVDHARSHRVAKRGRGQQKVLLDEAIGVPDQRDVDLAALDDALTSLATIDPQKGRIVELRFFGGLTIEETAKVLNLSSPTVIRQWRMAKAWLYRELNKGGDQ